MRPDGVSTGGPDKGHVEEEGENELLSEGLNQKQPRVLASYRNGHEKLRQPDPRADSLSKSRKGIYYSNHPVGRVIGAKLPVSGLKRVEAMRYACPTSELVEYDFTSCYDRWTVGQVPGSASAISQVWTVRRARKMTWMTSGPTGCCDVSCLKALKECEGVRRA